MCSYFCSKYTIQSKIGEGTFSEVLKCKMVATGKTFAAKKLKKQFTHLGEAQSLSELVVLQKLSKHPNILSLLEYVFEPTEGRLFLIFDLMEMSLYDLIQTGKRCLPESRVKHLYYQILKGVEHLHGNGIFHRDIKPENILVKKTIIKLADFGSARGVQNQQPYTEYVSTRWYRAPECILTLGSYSPKMDIWACGCVFYELLTSKPLFPGANEIDQLTKIHQVTGTPNLRTLSKMRRTQSRLDSISFPLYSSMNLATILPFTSEGGRELLKRTLVYDPDLRTNVRRLLDHRYFNDLRENEYMVRQSSSVQNQKQQWSSCSLFNTTLNSDKKPKSKLPYRNSKEIPQKKLTTSSWAASSNTNKVVVAQSRSKPNNQVLPTTVKKRHGQCPKPIVKKNVPENFEFKKPADKIKSNSVGSLPTISCKQGRHTMVTKSEIYESSIKARRTLLPPIPEL